MKIQEYPLIEEITTDDMLVAGTNKGTKKVPINTLVESITPIVEGNLPEAPVITDPVIIHRNSFRGKNLGSEITEDQISAIQNGTFEDLYVGDYWEIDGINWRIADLDYLKDIELFHNVGTTKHNLILFPDKCLTTHKFNTPPNSYGSSFGQVYITYLTNNINTLLPATIKDNLLPGYRVPVYGEDLYDGNFAIIIGGFESSIFPPSVNSVLGIPYDAGRMVVAGKSIICFPQMPLFKLNSLYKESDNSYYTNVGHYGYYPVLIRGEYIGLNGGTFTGIRPFVVIG